MRRKVGAAIFAALFLVLGVFVVLFLLKADREISLSPDLYEVSRPGTIDSKSSGMSSDDVESISRTLSGKYKKKKNRENINDDYVYSIIPGYLNISDASQAERDAASSIDGKGPGEERVTYGETIFVLDKRTIAIWDATKEVYWVGHKMGDTINLGLLGSFLPTQSDGDESVLPNDFLDSSDELSDSESDEFREIDLGSPEKDGFFEEIRTTID